jgi:hypothetical protein
LSRARWTWDMKIKARMVRSFHEVHVFGHPQNYALLNRDRESLQSSIRAATCDMKVACLPIGSHQTRAHIHRVYLAQNRQRRQFSAF